MSVFRILLAAAVLFGSGCFLETSYPGLFDPNAEIDADEDGVFADVDCDDEDPLNYPGNTEVCDGQDNDCEDGANFDVAGEVDADGDGFLSCAECNDGTAAANPDAVEVCDGVDNDCNGEADYADGDTAEVDGDRDGYVTCGPFVDNGGTFDGGDDCDDEDPLDFPGGVETCNGDDEDCDGAIDNGFDEDSDGVTVCGPDGDVTETADNDCDDTDINDFPGGIETCNGDDEDCDGVADNGFDTDSDGVTTCGPDGDPTTLGDNDCDDGDPLDFPGALESCNGDDEDCDGVVDNGHDIDQDGFTSCGADGNPATTADNDCDDGDQHDFPGATETCDAEDDDCDGNVDEGFDVDGDGVTTCGPDGNIVATADNDCDDADPLDFPGGTETCNGDDEDCDGTNDNGFDTDNDGVTTCGPDGVAGNGDDDCDDTDPLDLPGGTETCNGDDEDCDGAIDNGFDTDLDSVTTCGPDGNPLSTADNDCDDTDATAFPGAAEVCDGDLEDCGGTIDDGFDVDMDTYTTCGADGIVGTADDDCDDDPATGSVTNPGATELCDGEDNDCNGAADAPIGAGDVAQTDYTVLHSSDPGGPAFAPMPGSVGCGISGFGTSTTQGMSPGCMPGMTFEWYGESVSAIGIHSDGWIDFDGALTVGHVFASSGVLPAGVGPFDMLAVAWEDLMPGNVQWGLLGAAPNATGIVRYNSYATMPPGPSPWSIEVQLDQATSVITIHYISAVGNGDFAGTTVGLQNGDASLSTVYVNNEPSFNEVGTAVQFTPYLATEIDFDNDSYLACDECDDTEPDMAPNISEICDGLDNDCNGTPDDGGVCN